MHACTRAHARGAQALQQERDGLLAEASARGAALAELDAQVAAAEGELGRNPHKARALELQARARAPRTLALGSLALPCAHGPVPWCSAPRPPG